MAEPTSYLSITVDLPAASSEPVQSLLHDAGALGLEVRDGEDPPMPGMRGPKPGEAIVIGFFDDRALAEEALAWVQEEFNSARAILEAVPMEDWSNSWKLLIRAVQVGRLWVGPPWMVDEAPADKQQIVIEPKMAFGTGDHPTTSLCLDAVDRHLAKHPGDSVLDVGTGTGVLAIAARKLGARRVVGIDNDLVSVDLALENAVRNHVDEVELSSKTLDRVLGPFGLVVANILANTLVVLAPAICAQVAHHLVLAGVLVHQREEVEAAYRALGLVPLPPATQGEWIRLEFVRR